jgi:hypothetical protein
MPNCRDAERLCALGEREHLWPGRHPASSIGQRHWDDDADPHPAQSGSAVEIVGTDLTPSDVSPEVINSPV